MDFKNAVKALQIGKKEGKKFRLSTEFGRKSGRELPVSGISASADAPGKLDKSERMVGVCVHGNAEKCQNSGTEKF